MFRPVFPPGIGLKMLKKNFFGPGKVDEPSDRGGNPKGKKPPFGTYFIKKKFFRKFPLFFPF